MIMSSYFVTATGITIETSGAVVVCPQDYSRQYQVPVDYSNMARAIRNSQRSIARSYTRHSSTLYVTARTKTYSNASAPPLDCMPS